MFIFFFILFFFLLDFFLFFFFFFFSSRRRHTRWPRDWSSDVCSSDLFHKSRIARAPIATRIAGKRRKNPPPRGRDRFAAPQWMCNRECRVPRVARPGHSGWQRPASIARNRWKSLP